MNTATFSYATLAPALPEIVLACILFVLLVIDAFLSERDRHITYWLTIATLVGTAVLAVTMLGAQTQVTFHGLFVADAMSQVLKGATLLTVAATLMVSRTNLAVRGLLTGEFLTLSLFGALGMMVMISAHHFLTLYLGLELMALSQYAMVALQRDSARATEAGMKYFVPGALSSGLLLYGMSMLYGATGSLELTRVAAAIERGMSSDLLAAFGLVFIVAGIAFKLGAAPFHMWIPDVYHGAATPATLIVAAAPKIAAFGFVMRLLAGGMQGLVGDWQLMLVLLAVFSLAIGNIVAIAQTNLKRMLAYSTISHMGFMLLGFLSGTPNGYGASMFYIAVYVLTVIGAFAMVMLLSRRGFDADNLDDFKGLNQRNPWYAFIMLLLMFSLAGVPPAVGFYGKLVVFQAAMDAGLVWLAVVAVLFSLIGAFYYLRVVKLMYFDAPQDLSPLPSTPDVRALLTINGLAVLVLGLLPGGLMDLCQRAIQASLQ
jgi:NADH-quinone oxidoreductase subunit N